MVIVLSVEPAMSWSSTPTNFKGGTLKAFPFLGPYPVPTSPTGTASLFLPMPFGLPACTELWLQFGIQDDAAINKVALSNAILGIIP